jgi:hypothetical protein
VIAPFVLVEGRDVSLHPSLEALTSHVEAQDVRDGVYEAFDSEGRQVRLAAPSDLSAVTAEQGDPAGDRLRVLLIDHVVAIGTEPLGITKSDLASVDLTSLLRTVSALQRSGSFDP